MPDIHGVILHIGRNDLDEEIDRRVLAAIALKVLQQDAEDSIASGEPFPGAEEAYSLDLDEFIGMCERLAAIPEVAEQFEQRSAENRRAAGLA